MKQVEENKPLITVKHSGLTRAYFKTIDWQLPLPNVKEVIKNPDEYVDLLYHLAMNHKGLNWHIYRKLSPDTYPLFIFALAYCAKNVNTTIAYSWQLASNARRVYNYVTRNGLRPYYSEKEILKIAKIFPKWMANRSNRINHMDKFITRLKDVY